MKLPRLPVTLNHAGTALHSDPPAMGSDTRAILRELGLGEAAIETLFARGIVAADQIDSKKQFGSQRREERAAAKFGQVTATSSSSDAALRGLAPRSPPCRAGSPSR